VADLPKDAVIGGVEEMLPPPVKAEVAAPEPTPEDADDARRASAIGGSSAEPTSPTDDNAHAM